jgi:hypothetical protein
MLGFSHIASTLNQVTKVGGKENLMWGKSQQQVFDDLKHSLCSTPILSLPDLHETFEIETNASDYFMGAILTQHDNIVAHHSETLSYVLCKYPTYEK